LFDTRRRPYLLSSKMPLVLAQSLTVRVTDSGWLVVDLDAVRRTLVVAQLLSIRGTRAVSSHTAESLPATDAARPPTRRFDRVRSSHDSSAALCVHFVRL
ncbi:hypothetical protein PENTCL1PPCAC_19977, partial [Pristionchus entomophagus]